MSDTANQQAGSEGEVKPEPPSLQDCLVKVLEKDISTLRTRIAELEKERGFAEIFSDMEKAPEYWKELYELSKERNATQEARINEAAELLRKEWSHLGIVGDQFRTALLLLEGDIQPSALALAEQKEGE